MSRGLDGTNPRSYVGVRPLTPPNMIIPGIRPTSQPRDPTQNDIQYNLGDMWLNTNTEGLWYLAALGSHLVGGINTRFATWLQFSTGDDELETLTGDTGGPVGPDANKNINTLGTAGHITVAGNPGTNTLVWDIDGSFANSYPTDSGTAVPAANVLNIITNNAAIEAGSSVLFTGVGNTVQLHVTDSDSNTLVGQNSGNLTLSGAGNTGLGGGSLNSLTSGDANTGLGLNALQLLTSTDNNTAVGNLALANVVTGSGNTAIGQNAGSALTTNDSNNTLINYAGIAGSNSKYFFQIPGGDLFFHNAGTDNTFVGAGTGNTTLTGNSNVAVGVFGTTLVDITSGNSNNAFGRGALSDLTTGSQNNAFGNALNHVTTGNKNTAIGYFSGDAITTGSFNVCVGNTAGFSTVGDGNICINHSGAVESNVLRIGDPLSAENFLNKAFIAGIRGVTTDVNDAIAVLIDSAGQLGTVSSSIRFKENIEDMGDYSDDILRLRPVTFNYKNRPCERKSVGLIAEEVGEVMPDLVVFDNQGLAETIRYNDLVPLLLNEVQKMKVEIQQLQAALNK